MSPIQTNRGPPEPGTTPASPLFPATMQVLQTPEQLEARLLEQLRLQQWQAGHRLPTERELSATSGLGRASVRRVLGRLKERGLISQTVGSGTYVTAGAAAMLAGGDEPNSRVRTAALRTCARACAAGATCIRWWPVTSSIPSCAWP